MQHVRIPELVFLAASLPLPTDVLSQSQPDCGRSPSLSSAAACPQRIEASVAFGFRLWRRVRGGMPYVNAHRVGSATGAAIPEV